MSDISHLVFVRAEDTAGQIYSDEAYDSLVSLKNYLNNSRTTGWGHTWIDIDRGTVPFDGDDYSQDDSGEAQFVEDVMKHLAKNGELYPGDNVLISHGSFEFGYGGGEYVFHFDSGGVAKGHALFTGLGNTEWEARGFTWHELCHSYDVTHGQGEYDNTGNDSMYNITPMCMGYLFTSDNEPDTTWAAADPGDSVVPDVFCRSHEENFKYSDYEHPFKEDNHDIERLAYCTEEQIEEYIY